MIKKLALGAVLVLILIPAFVMAAGSHGQGSDNAQGNCLQIQEQAMDQVQEQTTNQVRDQTTSQILAAEVSNMMSVAETSGWQSGDAPEDGTGFHYLAPSDGGWKSGDFPQDGTGFKPFGSPITVDTFGMISVAETSGWQSGDAPEDGTGFHYLAPSDGGWKSGDFPQDGIGFKHFGSPE